MNEGRPPRLRGCGGDAERRGAPGSRRAPHVEVIIFAISGMMAAIRRDRVRRPGELSRPDLPGGDLLLDAIAACRDRRDQPLEQPPALPLRAARARRFLIGTLQRMLLLLNISNGCDLHRHGSHAARHGNTRHGPRTAPGRLQRGLGPTARPAPVGRKTMHWPSPERAVYPSRLGRRAQSDHGHEGEQRPNRRRSIFRRLRLATRRRSPALRGSRHGRRCSRYRRRRCSEVSATTMTTSP